MLLIKNGFVCTGETEPKKQDLLIEDGKIVEIACEIKGSPETQVINAGNLFVAPGLVDMHVHLRDPGFEYKEDINSGAEAAAAGGMTTIICMPNTNPPIDNPDTINYVTDKAKTAPVNILTCAAVTKGQCGEELTDFAVSKKHGAIALSDDGNPIQNAALMRKAMIDAKKQDLLIICHCEDAELVQNHGVNEGKISQKLAIPGRPAIAEEIMVARDVMLAAETGARVHIAHVSAKGSVEIIRQAKKAGVKVTAETAPQYFTLTEDEILKQGSLARVNPPLRTKADNDAIIEGLKDGTLDMIATDHAPHSMNEKMLPITEAMSGLIGLETSLALALTYLYHTGILSINDVIKLMSVNPARILGINAGRLQISETADIVIFDPNEKWTVDPLDFKSKARNTPFNGMELKGKVKYTICKGKIVYHS